MVQPYLIVDASPELTRNISRMASVLQNHTPELLVDPTMVRGRRGVSLRLIGMSVTGRIGMRVASSKRAILGSCFLELASQVLHQIFQIPQTIHNFVHTSICALRWRQIRGVLRNVDSS
jgi:hypothetical protein